MKHPFLYLTLLLGVACWSVSPVIAKDDEKKLTRAEKKELKKKEKEAKRAAKKKGKKDDDDDDEKKKGKGDKDDDDDKDKKVDKKAVSNAMKKLKTASGKAKGNGKFYMYVQYTTLTEAGEEMLKNIIESDRDFKAAKVNVLLINNDPTEEEDAVKALKKLKTKYPMVMKGEKLAEELPGYTPQTAPYITIVDPSGKTKASGGPELLDSWHTAVGAKAPKKKAKAEDDAEEGSDEE